MTHASTEKPEALMKLADDYAEACFDQGLNQRTTDDKPEAAREKLEKELRRLHARVQELEASQAQRVPLTPANYDEILRCLRARMGRKPLADDISLLRAIEAAHGITQEKQG